MIIVGDNGHVQGIQGTLMFTNPPNIDTINVDDSMDNNMRMVAIDATTPPGDSVYGRIQGLSQGGTIEFRIGDVKSPVTVQTGLSGSIVNVLATFAGISIVSHGPDTVNIGNGGSVQDIHGNVSVSNVSKPVTYTTLVIDDSTDQVSRTMPITITNAAITGLAPAVISYAQSALRSLTIQGGPGNNAYYNVQSTPNHGAAGTVETSLTCRGSDPINVGNAGSVQGITGVLNIHNGGVFTTLNVDDSSDFSHHSTTITNSDITNLAPAPIKFDQSGLWR